MYSETQSIAIAVACFIIFWFTIGYLVLGDAALRPFSYIVDVLTY